MMKYSSPVTVSSLAPRKVLLYDAIWANRLRWSLFQKQRKAFFKEIFIYYFIFIWLHRVLIATRGTVCLCCGGAGSLAGAYELFTVAGGMQPPKQDEWRPLP